MFLNLLLAPIAAPFTGLIWMAEQIQQRVDTDFDNQENLSKKLLALQLAFDMGDIPEEEFEAQEEELLLAIQDMEDRAKAEQAEEDSEEA